MLPNHEMSVNLCSINCRGLKDPNRLNQIISQCCGSNLKLQNLVLHIQETKAKRKKAKTRIQAIKIDANDVTCDEDRINQEFVDLFTERFSKPFLSDDQKESKIVKTHQVIYDFCSKMSEQINEIRDLCSNRGEITETEVTLAIKQLNPDSAPGLDGLTSKFYKAHSDFFIPYLCSIYNQVFSEKRVPVSIQNAVVKFTPKKTNQKK